MFSQANSSATFERQGVRELGLRCFFKSSTGFTFGNGETSANFQIFGRRCSLNDELMILETGKASSSAYSLRSQLGISSGPHAFDGFSVASSFIILSSDTSCSFGESVGLGTWSTAVPSDILRVVQGKPD